MHLYMRRVLFIASCFFLGSCSFAQTQERLVLTSVAPLFKITETLLQETNISLENIPSRPRSLASQATLFSRRGEEYAAQFIKADAVITMGKIWAEDSFYTTAREANIRIVNIDASKPWSHIISGVAVSRSPINGEVSPYFWTSPSNTIRMLNIIARDLQSLYPDQTSIIKNNLERERAAYLTLKSNFEKKFIEVLDPVVFSLSDDFTYLTSDLGIFVDGYFVKQDIDWTEQDLLNLSDNLSNKGIKTVLHKWEPSEEIQEAIEKAGAELLILNLMEISLDDYRLAMETNLNTVLAALIEKQ